MSMTGRYIVFLSVVLAFITNTIVGHTKTNSAPKVQFSKSLKHTVGGREFIWQFNCNGGECAVGTFVGGDYWIAPKNLGEKVTIESVSPDGDENGLMMNPDGKPEQGFLYCDKNIAEFYKASLNLMTRLPIEVKSSASLVKAAKKNSGGSCWGKGNKHECCIDAYDVLTILSQPVDDSNHFFRPGFAGDNKKLYKLDDFELNKIPTIQKFPTGLSKESFESIGQRWHSAYVDHFLSYLGDKGRAFAPNSVLPNYGAEQNKLYLDNMLSIMGPEPLEKKLPAITGLIQRGLDVYSSMQSGVLWPGGAGQSIGRKPPMVFFATLVNDGDVKRRVMSMADTEIKNTQEDVQVRVVPSSRGGSGQPIWGNTTGFCSENFYWAQLFNTQEFDGGSKQKIGNGDSKRTCGDPYGWIDGPAGVPGSAYMACCSTGGFIEYVFSLFLMPEMCDVAKADVLIKYVNRVLTHGILTQPDVCAPPDSRESRDCKPFKPQAPGCLYYGKTWGPNPIKPGTCITNGPNQKGRFPELDGKSLAPISNEGKLSLLLRDKLGVKTINACNVIP